MIKNNSKWLIIILFILFSCSKKKSDPIPNPPIGNRYPSEISNIIINRCAVSGCHTDESKDANGGFSLSSWEKLFNGGIYGAEVIPYRPDQSPLMYRINTYTDLGQMEAPTMPIKNNPLTHEEVMIIRDWINKGAPDKDGVIKFSDNPNRKKIYVANQGCDLIAVIDDETKLVMRYITVGLTVNNESPHIIKLSPDKKYLYTSLSTGKYFQKIDTETDQVISQVDIGSGQWTTFQITPDRKTAFQINWSADGSIVVIDLEKMSILTSYQGSGLLTYPHGSMINQNGTFLYVTALYSNFIYKINVTDINNPDILQISLDGNPPGPSSAIEPHAIYFSPDYTKYFITSQKSNNLLVFQTSTDKLIGKIPVGINSQHIVFSKSTSYAFVTCMEDKITFPGKIGSISVINYSDLTFVKSVFTGFQPHGIAIDDSMRQVYVVHRNMSNDGPLPKYQSSCGGRNGYLTIIDLNTLEVVPDFKMELSVDPYFIAVKR